MTLQGENTRLQDTQRNLKEDLERARVTIKSLKEQIKSQRDDYSRELQELKLTVSNEKHKHDTERSDLQEQLTKVCAQCHLISHYLLSKGYDFRCSFAKVQQLFRCTIKYHYAV